MKNSTTSAIEHIINEKIVAILKTLLLLIVTFAIGCGEKVGAQSYTISYTGLGGNTSATGVPTGIVNTTPYNGVTASCVTSANGATTSYSTVLTAATGYNFTVTSVSGTAYASSAGSKAFTFQISSNNGDFTIATSATTTIGSSSSCAGNTALTALSGTYTIPAGHAVTITVLRAAGGATGGGYSFTKSLNISGVVTAIPTATAPAISTGAATAIGTNGVTLNGIASSKNATTTVSFNYGTTISYGTNAPASQNPLASTASSVSVSSVLTSLAVNTFYNFRATATNSIGTTNGSNLSFWTLANTPTAPIFSSPTVNSLNVTIGVGDGNPAVNTTYAIQDAASLKYVQADGTLGVSAFYQSAAAWANKTITGLTQSTTYTFKVVAKNGASVSTAFGPSGSGTTSAPPTIPTANLSALTALTESNLDGGAFTITLQNVIFNTVGALPTSAFTLINAPSSASIVSVVATSITSATVTLSFEGEDFDADINNFNVTIAAAQLSSGEDLTSGNLSITALIETISTGIIGNLGNICINTISTPVSYTVSGTGLRDNVTITAPVNFQVSLSNSPFVSSGPITLSLIGNVLSSTTVYVRYAPVTVGATGNRNIMHTTTGGNQDVLVAGTGIYTPPIIIAPFISSLIVDEVSIGANITSVGCADITERGIYWSTVPIADGEGTKISEEGGPFSTGVFSMDVTNLPNNLIIYYKGFATNSIGTVYTAQASFTSLKLEPSENPTAFTCGTTGSGSIPLTWTDATGGETTPDGYLIKWNPTSFDAITEPSDGNATNGVNSITINQGIHAANIIGLLPNTTYYFKIYSYTNSGTNIDYKTDNVLQTSCTTIAPACYSSSSANINWNFTDGTANPNNAAIANLTVGAITQGNNNGTTPLISATSASAGYAGVSGTNNAGAAANTGALNTGSGSAYFQFVLTPATGYRIALTSINFAARSTGTGPQAFTCRSSLDNYTTDIAAGVLSNNSTWELKTISGLNFNSASAVTIRLYGYNGTGSPSSGTANWRIDDIILGIAVTNIPSAATVGVTQNVCGSLTSTSLGGNTPLLGTGKWSQISGPGATNFSAISNGSSTATASILGTYIYRWSISNGCSTINTADITVNYKGVSTSATLSGTTTICGGSANLQVAIVGGVSPYTILLNDGTSVDNYISSSNIPVSPTITKTYTITSVISSGGCIGTGNNGTAIITVNSATILTAPAAPTSQTVLVNDPSPANLTVTATGAALTYQWFSNGSNSNAGGTTVGAANGGQTNSFTPPTNVLGTKYYYLVVTGTCGTVTSSAVAVTITNTNTWKAGNATTNWSLAANWTGNAVPTGANDAAIPVGNTPYPALTASVSVNNLVIDPTATVSLNGFTLTTNGAVTGTGTLSGSATSNLITNASTGLLFTPGANTLKDLTVSAGTTTLSNALNITGGTAANTYGTVTVAPGATLASGGNLTIKSNQFGTARVAAGDVAGNYITGDVTVERYIPQNSKRAWRLLSVPTKGTKTIKQTWQENQAAGANGTPGFGTIITSNIATAASLQAAGFDAYSQLPSMQSYNSATQGWVYVTSTNAAPIQSNKGYFLYIRGDRSVSTSSSTDAASATTLRTTGTLYQGNSNPSVSIAAGKFEPVGNTFASAIDFTSLSKTGGISNTFYVWDSKLLSGTTLGAYQTFNGSIGYTPATPGGSYPAGVPNTSIESGEAFMLGATGTAGTVTLVEASKTTGNQFTPFRPAALPAQFKTSLVKVNGSTTVLADNNIVVFDNAYKNAVDADDALKIQKAGETMSIVTDGKALIIDARQPVSSTDVISFNVSNLQPQAYKLSFSTQNMNTAGLTAFVEDKYLQTSTAINLDGVSDYGFTAEAGNAASVAADRFKVVFKKAAATAIAATKTGFTISPNPVEGGVVNVQFKNQAEGKYLLRLLNSNGQTIFTKSVIHLVGNNNKLLNLPAGISSGIYELEITSPDKKRVIQNLIIHSK